MITLRNCRFGLNRCDKNPNRFTSRKTDAAFCAKLKSKPSLYNTRQHPFAEVVFLKGKNIQISHYLQDELQLQHKKNGRWLPDLQTKQHGQWKIQNDTTIKAICHRYAKTRHLISWFFEYKISCTWSSSACNLGKSI